ncbi:MAG: BCD family MFS transporter [Pseudomonadota bacterium]
MTLSWLGIFRLGIVQMTLGAIVVLTTSTLNRLMVVELALPAILPGLLVGLHYGVQLSRPKWGFVSDMAGLRTKWIVRGVGVLALGALIAAAGVVAFPTSFALGLAISILGYVMIGVGVGAGGTSMLALLASATAPRRRAAAATITWMMMIFGIVVTAIASGAALDPYSPERLMVVVAVVAGVSFIAACLATWRIEAGLAPREAEAAPPPFWDSLREVWADDRARNFTIFVFLSMTAYFMQELILEPYAGLVFAFTPGQSTSLSGAQNGGVFIGMALVGIAATGFRIGALRHWVVLGCLGSAAALAAVAAMGEIGVGAPLVPAVMALGFFNGVFAVAAIGSMMALAGEGRERREGTRMGLWGAAQAIAAGFGGLAGAAAADALRLMMTSDAAAFGAVFLFEAVLFLAAALMALRVIDMKYAPRTGSAAMVPGE